MTKVAAHITSHHSPKTHPTTTTTKPGFFERYCAAVEGSAEWGGELELRALVRSHTGVRFTHPTHITSANAAISACLIQSTLSICTSAKALPPSPKKKPKTHTHTNRQCHALQVPITVYSAEAPPLQMGHDEYGGEAPPLVLTCVAYTPPYTIGAFSCGPPLTGCLADGTRLSYTDTHSFHRHYYALGEHYNSVLPA